MKLSRILPILALAVLAACSGNDVTQTLGLNKEAPDEFVVVSRPPLVVPPEFDLMPPRPGEESPHAQSTESQARKLLLGIDANGAATTATGNDSTQSLLGEGSSDTPTLEEFMNSSSAPPKVETALDPVVAADPLSAPSANFLKQAGADATDSNIRQELRTAAPTPTPDEQAGSLLEQMVGKNTEEPLVDPAKEAERLRANKDEGKPVTEGDTPTVDTQPKSVLDRVF
jgi:hypothetical protein